MKEEANIPVGVPKSGRIWKVKQVSRSSSVLRKGILSHLAKSFEEKEAIRQKNKNTKDLENEMLADKKQKKLEEKTRREEQQKRRADNEYKHSVYQAVSNY